MHYKSNCHYKLGEVTRLLSSQDHLGLFVLLSFVKDKLINSVDFNTFLNRLDFFFFWYTLLLFILT